MPRHRHVLTAATTALLLSVSTAGCADKHVEGVTLRLVVADYEVRGQSDNTEQYWNDLITAFEAAHPDIKVKVDVEPWDYVDGKVAAMAKAGQAPDLAQLKSYADFAERGDLYSVDSLVSIPVQSNFVHSLAVAGERDRTQYAMPFTASTRLLFYNKDLFAKAGISNPPKTWDELKAAAQKLNSRTRVPYPIAVPLGPEEAHIEAMAWMLGGEGGYTNFTGSYAISSKNNLNSLTWLKENLVTEGLTGPVPVNKLNRRDAYAAFLRGEAGMVNGHPSLLQAAKAAGIRVGVVPVPSHSGKSIPAPAVVDWMMGFKRNGHRKELGTFLNFVFKDKNVWEFATRNNLLPVTVSVTEQMKADAEHEDLGRFLEELPASELPPVGKSSWAVVSDSIKRNIGTAMTSGGSPATTLDVIANDAKKAEGQPR
ncbi:extracellular solute-binding protein [Streptomyces sp. NBC_00250]|uniref:extracellular solute-binding protein n=1 Tax=Streptomyces sp. NBC_00250 TaxID=2903641 RepID=UPI002E295680|nr:extracellular solute-binding protein [Streptomyces sp. NBC_00250]